MKIEIGGQREMDGWTNLDLKEGFNVILDELPVEDNSVEYLYMSHVIEHIPFVYAAQVLHNLYKKVKPGGKIRILCPDMDVIVDKIFHEKTREPWINFADWKIGTVPFVNVIFGNDAIANAAFMTAHPMRNSLGRPTGCDLYLSTPDGRLIGGITHCACWSGQMLGKMLHIAGFRNVTRTGFEEIDTEQERLGQLCMNGYKLEETKHTGGLGEFIRSQGLTITDIENGQYPIIPDWDGWSGKVQK